MTLPKRINITGASGSGTSTLGRALADRCGAHHFDTDDYYWLPSDPPFRSKRSPADRLSMLLRDMSTSEPAVLSGSVVQWGDALERSFELVIFLYIPHELRMARLSRRETELFGAPDPDFMQWAARYDTGDLHVRSRQLHEAWLATICCPVLRLEGDLTTHEQIELTLRECAHLDRSSALPRMAD